MIGERYRQMLERGVNPLQQAQADRTAPSFADRVSLQQAAQTCPALPSLAPAGPWRMLDVEGSWHNC